MATRIRKVTKIKNGTYYYQNWKVSDYIIINIIYYICIFPYYLFFKYCMFIPIKWVICKITDKIKEN